MNIVSFNNIIELNNLLQKNDLQFKVHIRDACGAQSFYIEPLDSNSCEETRDKMFEMIEKYFESNKMTVVYYEDKYNFTIK